MTTRQKIQIFLSYAPEDAKTVTGLYHRLSADGFRLWFDRFDLLGGQDRKLAIKRAVQGSVAVVACLSDMAIFGVGSRHRELSLALDIADEQPEGTIFIIPLRLQPCNVPDRLEHLQHIDFYDPDGYDRLKRALIARLQDLGHDIIPELEQIRHRALQSGYDQVVDQLLPLLRHQPVDRRVVAYLAQLAETAAVPLSQRLRAAREVALHGDPRLPVSLHEWLASVAQRPTGMQASAWDDLDPPAYWRFLPSMTYQIGAQLAGTRSARLHLRSFWIARLPITVAQYRRFVGQGGTPPKWWGNATYTGDNQPVIGVTWREASQFCAWLTDRLANGLPPNYVIRLPTEAEWEAAASADIDGQRRTAPWGSAPLTPDHAIHLAHRLKAAAPVGCCPLGAAACGALDMAGNVWELTNSEWEGYPHLSHRRVGDGWNRQIAWRGGGWHTDAELIGSGTRGWVKISTPTDPDGGFRVALAPRL